MVRTDNGGQQPKTLIKNSKFSLLTDQSMKAQIFQTQVFNLKPSNFYVVQKLPDLYIFMEDVSPKMVVTKSQLKMVTVRSGCCKDYTTWPHI